MTIYSEAAFPTEGVVPEARQIGRIPAIEGLVRRLRQSGQHWALIDHRRVGKSSVALAALGRLDEDPNIATVAVDLRRLGVRSEHELVNALRTGGVGAGIDVHEGLRRFAGRAKIVLQGKAPDVAAEVGKLLGLPERVADVADIAQALAGTIGGDGQLTLLEQLLAFEAWGLTQDAAVVVFIDEVQDLAGWRDGTTLEDLSRAMRWPLRNVRLLFAGSERHSMEALFAEGRPLRENTLDYDLTPIAREDWLHALPGRFAEMRFTVERAALDAALDATPERPLRTNQVCLQAVTSAPDYGYESHVDAVVMSYAVDLVRRRDRWETETDDA